jgi:hypothetical protein
VEDYRKQMIADRLGIALERKQYPV